MEYSLQQGSGSGGKLPSSFWYFLIVVSIIVGAVVWNCTCQKHYPEEKVIETKIDSATTKRNRIIQEVKESSLKAAKKGDSLIRVLQTEPWRLDKKDLEDSVVREYLRNYKYQ